MSTKASTKELPEVAILWCSRSDPDGLTLNTLGPGSTRVYAKDHYDSRLDLGRDREKEGPLPFFAENEGGALWDWLAQHIGQQCQVALPLARKMGF